MRINVTAKILATSVIPFTAPVPLDVTPDGTDPDAWQVES